MKAEYERYELIGQYLEGKLTGDALAAFESSISVDPGLAGEVEKHKAIHELIIDHALLELKAKMKVYDTGGNNGGSNVFYIVTTVILIASLTGIGVLTLSKKTGTEQPQVVVNHQQITDGSPGTPVQKEKSKAQRSQGTPLLSGKIVADSVQAKDYVASIIPADKPLVPDTILLKKDLPPAVREPFKTQEIKRLEPVPCQLEHSVIQYHTSESCSNQPTGEITIDRTSSFAGELPLSFSIDGKTYHTSFVFDNLYPGIYYLSVKDARGCTWDEAKEITVNEKDCTEHEYSFHPDKGEVWKFPATASEGKIEIYSRNGAKVYSSAIYSGSPEHWDGTSDGRPLPMGSYSFVIKMEGKVITGHVTVFR